MVGLLVECACKRASKCALTFTLAQFHMFSLWQCGCAYELLFVLFHKRFLSSNLDRLINFWLFQINTRCVNSLCVSVPVCYVQFCFSFFFFGSSLCVPHYMFVVALFLYWLRRSSFFFGRRCAVLLVGNQGRTVIYNIYLFYFILFIK